MPHLVPRDASPREPGQHCDLRVFHDDVVAHQRSTWWVLIRKCTLSRNTHIIFATKSTLNILDLSRTSPIALQAINTANMFVTQWPVVRIRTGWGNRTFGSPSDNGKTPRTVRQPIRLNPVHGSRAFN